MIMRVRCLLCNEVLDCLNNETGILLEHVKDKHPDIKMTRMPNRSQTAEELFQKPEKLIQTSEKVFQTTDKLPRTISTTDSIKKQPSFLACYCNQSIRKTSSIDLSRKCYETTPKRGHLTKCETKKAEHRKKLYKTSIEKWRPGKDKITCLMCGACRRPVIRSHAEKVATSPGGAACLLTFWPFCFMPFLFPPPTRHMLHCGVCGYLFGEYDRKLLQIKPMNLLEMQVENVVKM